MICKMNKVLHLHCLKSESENPSPCEEVKLEVKLKDKDGSRRWREPGGRVRDVNPGDHILCLHHKLTYSVSGKNIWENLSGNFWINFWIKFSNPLQHYVSIGKAVPILFLILLIDTVPTVSMHFLVCSPSDWEVDIVPLAHRWELRGQEA